MAEFNDDDIFLDDWLHGYYEDWRKKMIEQCEKLPNRICPFCGDVYDDNAEYVDVGVGHVQVTANYCENCGASEQGAYEYDEEKFDFKGGWVRSKEEPEPKYDFNPASVMDFIDGTDMPEIQKEKVKGMMTELYEDARNQR